MAAPKRLNNEEKEAQDFISLAFKPHEGKWKDTFTRLKQGYKGYYYSTVDKRTRFTINTFFNVVNLLLPNFIFQQPYIRVKPHNARYFTEIKKEKISQIDNIANARNSEAMLNHHVKNIGAIYEDRKALQDYFFYGIGITKDGYSYETISQEDKDYIVKDTPFHRRVNPEDFGWHPFATGCDDSPMLVHRLTVLRSSLDENKFKNIDEIPSEVPEYLKDKAEKNFDNGSFKTKNYVTIYEVHDQEHDKVYTFGGKEGILLEKRKRSYSFLGSDFNLLKFAGDNDEFLGIPFLEMIEDEAIALNEILTLIVEHYRKFAGQVFIEEGSVDEDQLEKIRTGVQGSVHIVKAIDKILRANPLAMGPEYFQIVSLMQNLIDRILGIPDFQRLTSTSRKSATEASYIQGDSTIRRSYFLGIVKDFVLSGAEKQMALLQQFQDEKLVIQSSGELQFQVFEASKEDIKGKWQFDFDVDNMAAIDSVKMNSLVNLLSVTGQNPFFAPLYRTLDPFKAGKIMFGAVGVNYESISKSGLEEKAVYWNPEEENKEAEKGLMPRPVKGENYEDHLAVHTTYIKEKIQKLGQAAQQDKAVIQIIEHMAETRMLMDESMETPPQVAGPQAQMEEKGHTELAQPPNMQPTETLI